MLVVAPETTVDEVERSVSKGYVNGVVAAGTRVVAVSAVL